MSDPFVPFSERNTASGLELRDGVPSVLEAPLRDWIAATMRRPDTDHTRVAMRCGLNLQKSDSRNVMLQALWIGVTCPRDRLFDVVDATLNLVPTEGWRQNPSSRKGTSGPDSQVRVPLQHLLDDARSLYTIRADGTALAHRIDPAVEATVQAAIGAADQPARGSASRHLRQAMEAAYALKPDPVKAYSEAIKAVESAAHATIQPGHATATLGTMLAELRQTGDKLTVVIPGRNGTEGLDAVKLLMRLLWEGQTSRHGNLQVTREETAGEATMAVHTAALLVQLFSSGAIRQS